MNGNDMSLSQVQQWVADAKADGWTVKPLYHPESIETAALLQWMGYIGHAIMRKGWRTSGGTNVPEQYSLHLWGPDGMALVVPTVYDRLEISNNMYRCTFCNETTTQVVRLSFAGRACPACKARLSPELEKSGWYN